MAGDHGAASATFFVSLFKCGPIDWTGPLTRANSEATKKSVQKNEQQNGDQIEKDRAPELRNSASTSATVEDGKRKGKGAADHRFKCSGAEPHTLPKCHLKLRINPARSKGNPRSFARANKVIRIRRGDR